MWIDAGKVRISGGKNKRSLAGSIAEGFSQTLG
jgi:hypothetical protein